MNGLNSFKIVLDKVSFQWIESFRNVVGAAVNSHWVSVLCRWPIPDTDGDSPWNHMGTGLLYL